MFYALKSFAIKQMDILHRQAKREWDKGTPAGKRRSVKLTVAYGLLFAGSGSLIQETKDGIRGKGFNIEDLDDNAVDQIYSMVLSSRYMVDKFAKGKVSEGLIGAIIPPMSLIDAPMADLAAIGRGDFNGRHAEMNVFDSQVVQNTPLFGKIAYNWLGVKGQDKVREADRERRRR